MLKAGKLIGVGLATSARGSNIREITEILNELIDEK